MPPVDAPDGPPGVSLAALTGWLDAQHPGLRQGRLQAEPIAGGRSNLTYRLTDDTHRWALRRPPLGHVLPSAHDMGREYTVIAGLSGSPVPVPEPVALCTDRAVLGEPFYLMSFVDGVVIERPELVTSPARATAVSEQLVDTLVQLHAVSPADVGLAEFGRPEGFLARQLRRWHQQFEASAVEGGEVEAAVVEGLSQRLPASGAAAIVHGDYRLTNVLFQPDLTRIAAVVDWEMATLGDPLTDVGLLYVYHAVAGQSGAVMPDFSPDRGFLSAGQLVARYADRTGLDLSRLEWYIAFGFFKLAVIAAGIHARFLQGKTVGAGFDTFGELRDRMLEQAHTRLGGI